MREILFRGKRTYNGDWVEGCLYKNIYGDYLIREHKVYDDDVYIDDYNIIPESISEFTGLTDKNGKKIFEGDIIRNEYRYGQYQCFKVIYNERTYRWKVENKYGMLGELCNVIGNIEVIGNIHDKPELMEEGAE